MDNEMVELYDPSCPLIHKRIPAAQFEERIRQTPGNAHLLERNAIDTPYRELKEESDAEPALGNPLQEDAEPSEKKKSPQSFFSIALAMRISERERQKKSFRKTLRRFGC